MSTEKDESYTVVVKGKALASIKVFDTKSMFFEGFLFDFFRPTSSTLSSLCLTSSTLFSLRSRSDWSTREDPPRLQCSKDRLQLLLDDDLLCPEHKKVPWRPCVLVLGSPGAKVLHRYFTSICRCECRSTSPRWPPRRLRQLASTPSPSPSSQATFGGSEGSANTSKAWSVFTKSMVYKYADCKPQHMGRPRHAKRHLPGPANSLENLLTSFSYSYSY